MAGTTPQLPSRFHLRQLHMRLLLRILINLRSRISLEE